MKRTVPLLITAIAGFVLIISFFVPALQEPGEDAAIWFDILASIAFILGGGNLLKLHLKSISDQKPGWGYSAVTIVAFLVTLFFGLLKVGSPPTANTEFYGEVFANLPLSAMKETRIPGVLYKRADGELLPDSVRNQLREDNGELVFRGWMTEKQKQDLYSYEEALEWRYLIEQLHSESQPEGLAGKVYYYPEHEALSVRGILTNELQQAIEAELPDSPEVDRAIEELAQRSTRQVSVVADVVPSELSIPEPESRRLTIDGNTISFTGPMSAALRDKIPSQWSGFAPTIPLTGQEESDLREKIEELGHPLTSDQSEAFRKYFQAQWDATTLILAINTAGVEVPVDKTYAELIAEREAGVTNLKLKKQTGTPVVLNEQQEQAVEDFVDDPNRTVEGLKARLTTLGPLTDAQRNGIDAFIAGQPRMVETLHNLGIELLINGPLNNAQREFLFEGAARYHAWKASVGRLFIAAHDVKYPWSGEYSSEGNPFWWIYEFVLQPLMTTTFAMLAFYVASAAFRAFRAKNVEATLLLGTAFIVLLGRTFAGVMLTAWIPDEFSALKIDQMTVYIMKIFNTAGNRAIMIGIALGIASTSLKVLLGIDRSYLGTGDD